MTPTRIANLSIQRVARGIEPREYRLEWLRHEDGVWVQYRRYLWREEGEALYGRSIHDPVMRQQVLGDKNIEVEYEGIMHPTIHGRVIEGMLHGAAIVRKYPRGLSL